MAKKDEDGPPVDTTTDEEAFNNGLPPVPPPPYSPDASFSAHQGYPWDLVAWASAHLEREQADAMDQKQKAGQQKAGIRAWHTKALLRLFDELELPVGSGAVDAYGRLVTALEDAVRYEDLIDALADSDLRVTDVDLIEHVLPRTGSDPILVLVGDDETRKAISQRIFRRALSSRCCF